MGPLVSICCQTFNHEKFIGQCLEGFLLQQGRIGYEVLINEDASKDETAAIIKFWEGKFPDIIRCVYQKENQFGKQNTLVNVLFPMAKGKYIALCEGDDYWTDAKKLEMQVDFMERNPSVVLTFHNVSVLEDGQIIDPVKNNDAQTLSGISEILETHIPTNSVVFRNVLRNIPSQISTVPFGDKFLWGLLSQHGSFVKLDFSGAVYRRHAGGLWSRLKHVEKIVKRIKTYLLLAQVVRDKDAQAVIRLSRKKALTGFLVATKALNWKAMGFFLHVMILPKSVKVG